MKERIRVIEAKKSVGERKHSRLLWDDVSFTVNAGERVCLTGPSGCGKSTLLNCIGLLDEFDSGQIFLNGEEVTNASTRQKMKLRRHQIGYLFQDYALIDNETARQNVLLAANQRKDRNKAADDALAAVGLSRMENGKVYQLSGGEQQRVAMARLLVRQPSIVLADEPTASLDRKNATVILEHLQQLAHGGAAVIIVSHDPWVVDQCDRKEEIVDAK